MTLHKYFKTISFFSISLCISASAFDGGTLITTSSGRLKAIKELQVGDEVVCYNNNLEQEVSFIKGTYAFRVDCTIKITTADNVTITTSLIERFYLPAENQWVCAKNLKEGDYLLNEDMEQVAITNVEECLGKDVMYLITVDNQHNFLASGGKYLVHNGPIAGAIGYWATKTLCYGTGVAALTTVTVATGGTVGAAVGALTTAAAAGATTSAAIAGGAIAGAGLASEAAIATAAVASTAGGLAGTVAAIETASTGVWAALTLCPFLP